MFAGLNEGMYAVLKRVQEVSEENATVTQTGLVILLRKVCIL